MRDNKEILSIDLVEPGMITAEIVFNNTGNVLVWEDMTLDSNMILHLKNMGIGTIAVYKEQKPPFTIEYEQDVGKTKQIFQALITEENLDVKSAEEIVENVTAKSENRRNIIDSVTQVRKIDEYTYYHSLNVSMLGMLIGKWMRLDEYKIRQIALAGLLHDIGKAKIPPEILNKAGRLTEDEFAEMRRHSEYGYNIVAAMDEIPDEVAMAVLTHHEREDGSGYPIGLRGNQLGLYSKIIAVADIFDAMTANRTYKSKDTPFKVFELMQHGSFGVLDTKVLNAFLKNITGYYIGARVKLNTGETGEVVFMNKLDFSRPVVLVNGRYVDTALSKEKIVEFI